MAALADIRSELATNLATITGLQASAYELANPSPPTGWIVPDDPLVEFDKAMGRGLDVWHLIVEMFIARVTDRGAQAKLDAFITGSGAKSVKAAIETDKTLGGVAQDLHVTEIDGYGEYPLGERGLVLGFKAHVDVYTTGS